MSFRLFRPCDLPVVVLHASTFDPQMEPYFDGLGRYVEAKPLLDLLLSFSSPLHSIYIDQSRSFQHEYSPRLRITGRQFPLIIRSLLAIDYALSIGRQ